jgi:hypothetical protein
MYNVMGVFFLKGSSILKGTKCDRKWIRSCPRMQGLGGNLSYVSNRGSCSQSLDQLPVYYVLFGLLGARQIPETK